MKAKLSQRRRRQLRMGKQAQRARERRQGLVQLQLAVPAGLAAKLQLVRKAGLLDELEQLVDELVVRVANHPALRQLAWGLHDEHITAREAFALYERNWKHVDQSQLDLQEAAFIAALTQRYGAGVMLNG